MPGKRLSSDDLTPEQRAVLDADGDLLVVGRPGTGKTSIALLKALKHLEETDDPEAKVLFLSFSRAAVQRIEAASKVYVPRRISKQLAITTFHAFCFDILRSHARLVGMPRLNGIILPHEERMIAAEATERTQAEHELADLPFGDLLDLTLELLKGPNAAHGEDAEPLSQSARGAAALGRAEYARLEKEDGRVPFGRLLDLTLEIFRRHPVLRAAYARAYSLILVDEYQDTNDKQDELVDLLASPGQVIYLGDPEQRIYDWLPDVRHDRFERLLARRAPGRIDLPVKSHRSGASDLVAYSRAVLSGRPLAAKPKDVASWRYAVGQFSHQLRVGVMQAEKAARARLGKNVMPEIAIMSYKNDFVARMSRDLREKTASFDYPFAHRLHVGLEEIGPAWGTVLALLACPGGSPSPGLVADALTELGRSERAQGSKGGVKRAGTFFEVARALRNGGKISARSLRDLPQRMASVAMDFTGDPRQDVRKTIELMHATPGGYFKDVVETLELRSPIDGSGGLVGQLAEAYATHGYYRDARRLGDAFLLHEHLVRGEAGAGGRIVMTLHKCKGKEFDAVVIVDGPSDADSLVLREDDARHLRSRRLLAMAIARARYYVAIVTPAYRPCPLLPTSLGTALQRT